MHSSRAYSADRLRGVREDEVPNRAGPISDCGKPLPAEWLDGEKGPDERHINAHRVLREPAILAQMILVLLKKAGRG